MNMKKVFSMAGIVAIVTAGLTGGALAATSSPATVAQFVEHLSALVKPELADTQAAVGARATWMEVNASMPLTYGDVSRIAGELGVRVAPPANPDTVVSLASAGVMANQIASALVVAKSTFPADEGPTQCLHSNNRGSCVECCKEATGDGGKFCGRYCHSNVPPPISPEEPLP